MKKRVIAYWLVPAKAERELFRKLIHILAKEFHAPPFEPHLTLSTTREAQISPAKTLRSLRAQPIRLRILGTASSAKFTKTLFVRFGSNQTLEKLVARLAAGTKARRKVLRDPHISLLYKSLSRQLKKELASTMKFRIRHVTFDSIQVIRTRSPVRDARDVAAWERVATKRLSS